MFFEFESTTTNNMNNVQPKSLPMFSLSSSFSAINNEKNMKKSYLSTLPTSKSSSLSPLVIDSSSLLVNNQNISTHPQRHRRYSMHSCQTPVPLDTLKENSYCDLALITKKKLMLLNGPGTLKSLEERFIEPDIKLNQTFAKHSNSDLRKEVLLASIQRSLSVSTEDLHSLSSQNVIINEMQISHENTDCSNSSSDDYPMDFPINNNIQPISTTLPSNNHNDNSLSYESMSLDSYGSKRTTVPIQQRKAHRQRNLPSGSYMPSETHVNWNSLTTFTSTTSMAGSKNNNPSLNNCRNYIKNLNMNYLGGLLCTNMGSYYSRTSSPNLTCTVQSSPMRTSLKKRIYSTSPSKYSSPYHTIANTVYNNKDFDSIFTNSSSNNGVSTSGNMSPDWEIAFKRLKVMHNDNELFNFDSTNEQNHNIKTSGTSFTIVSPQSTSSKLIITNNYGSHKELNELAQDFHRLKTPFT